MVNIRNYFIVDEKKNSYKELHIWLDADWTQDLNSAISISGSLTNVTDEKRN